MFGAHIWSPAYCRAQADTQAKENANVTPREGQLLAPTGRDPLSSSESMCLPRHFLLVAMQTDVKYLPRPKLPSEVKVDIACRQSPNLQWNLTWNYHWIFNCFLKYSTQVNISFSTKRKGQYPMGDGELGYEARNLVHLAVPWHFLKVIQHQVLSFSINSRVCPIFSYQFSLKDVVLLIY